MPNSVYFYFTPSGGLFSGNIASLLSEQPRQRLTQKGLVGCRSADADADQPVSVEVTHDRAMRSCRAELLCLLCSANVGVVQYSHKDSTAYQVSDESDADETHSLTQ